ncbi:butyrophilin-like protein 10 isoform X2 [Tachysurus fulvidraco]|uniref:butyrophilin-like protein 10 isoform X2 n=1 Tax=Tachysurus fulvidraco TaxID=1234273 RepID=UPI001FEF62F3|nr:butyrophilin-like protein 10 isoform X2 [Tachysurus fulvidraco]
MIKHSFTKTNDSCSHIVLYSWFKVLFVCFSVLGQSVRLVNGTLGRSVILPCSTSDVKTNVYWRYKDSITVCDIIDGQTDFDEQYVKYKGRVETFQTEFPKGNFSIKLNNLTMFDAGIYTCNFPYTLIPVTVHLKVTVSHRKFQTADKDDKDEPCRNLLIVSRTVTCIVMASQSGSGASVKEQIHSSSVVHRRSPKTQTQPPGLHQQQDNINPVFHTGVERRRFHCCRVYTASS